MLKNKLRKRKRSIKMNKTDKLFLAVLVGLIVCFIVCVSSRASEQMEEEKGDINSSLLQLIMILVICILMRFLKKILFGNKMFLLSMGNISRNKIY